MNKKKKYGFIVYTTGMILLFTACESSSAAWNPSTISLTPSPTTVGQAEPTVTTIPSVSTDQTPTATKSPTASVTEGAPTATMIPETTVTTKPMMTVDDFDAADFFDDTVFAGDSVLSQFYWKVPFKETELFGGSNFLVAKSYSVREALKPVSDTSIHPLYKGEQHQIWDSMVMMNPRRVVLFFGLNDIGINGVNGFCENYQKLITSIQEVLPDVKLYIISTTPMRSDSETKNLTNANISAANVIMEQYCNDNGMGYIDIASKLMDETGALAEQYSDGTNVHQTKEAYRLWKDILVQYAKEQLLSEYNSDTE